MTTLIAPSSEAFALDLYGLLRELDPNHWREELEVSMQERVENLQLRLADLMAKVEEASMEPAVTNLRSRLVELKREMETHMPHSDLPSAGKNSAKQWRPHTSGMRHPCGILRFMCRHCDPPTTPEIFTT